VTSTLLRARASRAAVFGLAVLAAACSDQSASPLDPAFPPPVLAPKSAVAMLHCSADVRAGSLSCSDAPDGGARRYVGGLQNVDVKLTSTNVAYDPASQIFSADLTVQNLLVQRMGSDGATVSGVTVFFNSGPVVTSGTGSVEVANADGQGTFTAGTQPYFLYAGSLPYQAVSAPKRWEWSMPATVVNFSFTLMVSAPLVPTVVFDMLVSGNRDIYRMGIDGQDLTRLTTSTGDDRDPTVARGKVVFTSHRHGNAELYRVDLKGGGEVRLTTTTDNETSPALSPDGTQLAFIRNNSSVLGKLWRSNADVTDAVQPTAGFGFSGDVETGPTWLGNGRLAFVSTTSGSADVWSLAVPGTAPVKMGSQLNDVGDVDPSWNQDGRLAFASSRSGGTDLYAISAEGTLSQLTTRAGSDSHPSWLADGRVLFSCHMGSPRGARICLVTPGTPGTFTEITTPGPAERPVAVIDAL
jgi:hypothetical protein